ncbi:hypothetical protein NY78_0801 [Desulfovibrio sp. TomC]|nr:hypothetical protein NY78_0801 [Desulfovibrio sp. TomC]
MGHGSGLGFARRGAAGRGYERESKVRAEMEIGTTSRDLAKKCCEAGVSRPTVGRPAPKPVAF